MEIAKFFLFGGDGSFWEHSEDSECSEEWAEGGGQVRQVRRVRRVRQVGLFGERGRGRVRGRVMDDMRGCGCSGEQPYFLGGLLLLLLLLLLFGGEGGVH